MARFRVGLAIGFGVGYVLGARAGRERYVQIERAAKKAWESEPAAKMRAEVADKLPQAVHSAAAKVDELRHRNGDQDVVTAGQFPV